MEARSPFAVPGSDLAAETLAHLPIAVLVFDEGEHLIFANDTASGLFTALYGFMHRRPTAAEWFLEFADLVAERPRPQHSIAGDLLSVFRQPPGRREVGFADGRRYAVMFGRLDRGRTAVTWAEISKAAGAPAPVIAEEGTAAEGDGAARYILDLFIGAAAPTAPRERLAAMLSLTRAALESVDQAVIAVDRNANLITCNRRYVDLLGSDESRLHVGQSVDFMLDEAMPRFCDFGQFTAISAEIAREPNRVASGRIEFVDGRLFKVTARPLHVLGRPIGRVWSWLDVTEQERTVTLMREARDAAQAADRAKSQFLAMMSHELRTPMTGVLGILDLLEETDLDPEQKSLLATLKRSASLLRTVLDDVLDFSKIEAGRLTVETVPFRPTEVLRDVHELFEGVASGKGLVLDTAATAGWTERTAVIGDPFRVRQVLLNLVGNAVKFTDRGSVRVRLGPMVEVGGQSMLTFSIADTRAGIPPDRVGHLFESFYQADKGIARKFGGTGLGLAICKRLVVAMGGTIDCVSEVGVGTTFSFTIPAPPTLLPMDIDPATAVGARGGGTSVEPRRLLLAEDNPVTRFLVATRLRRRGHQVDAVETGMEAVERCRTGGYDLVLMDVQMPVMDGLEATRVIRALPTPQGAVPIYAMTADVISGLAETHGELGFDGFLAKPVDWVVLDRVLSVAAGRSAAMMTAGSDPAPANDPLVDPAMVNELVETLTHAGLLDLLQTFEASTAGYLDDMTTAFARWDLRDVARAAHAIKGAARALGMVRLGRLAEMAEHHPNRDPAIVGDLRRCAAESAGRVATTGLDGEPKR